MRNIAISAGHGKYIRGASGSPVPPELDEVNEARRVVQRVFDLLDDTSVHVVKFWDDTSHDQNTNLNTIVNWHNKQSRDLDVSVHFNATEGAYGTEVWWKTQKDLATKISAAIAKAGGFKDRGQKHTDSLFFLNSTNKPAVLLEICFCDSTSDSNLFNANFEAICKAVAESIADVTIGTGVPPLPEHPPPLEIPEPVPGDEPVRVTVEHPPGVKVKLTKSYNNTGFIEVDIQHPRGVQVDTDVREVSIEEPEEEGIPSNQMNIIATVFKDDSTAYPPYDGMTDTELSVSLPANIPDEAVRQSGVQVWNRLTGKTAVGKVRDKGPWLVDDDDYVFGDKRPLAETCYNENKPLPRGPHEGKVPNGAGIDLSPGLAAAIGISGKGTVDWDWV